MCLYQAVILWYNPSSFQELIQPEFLLTDIDRYGGKYAHCSTSVLKWIIDCQVAILWLDPCNFQELLLLKFMLIGISLMWRLLSKYAISNVAMNPSLVLQPVLGTSASTKENPPIKKGKATISPKAEPVSPSHDINNGENAPINISSTSDSEKMSLEQAAIMAQAAIRGYQVFSCS